MPGLKDALVSLPRYASDLQSRTRKPALYGGPFVASEIPGSQAESVLRYVLVVAITECPRLARFQPLEVKYALTLSVRLARFTSCSVRRTEHLARRA
jgi:hypothetical protein